MHEKDIELAKLLLSKLHELEGRRAKADAELARVESELEGVRKLREERSQYLEILARAAQLLNREDLKEELPETSALEDDAEKLLGELDEIRQTAAQYEELVQGLRERAPHLLESANAEAPQASVAEVEATAVNGGDEPVAEPPSATADSLEPVEDEEHVPLLEPATAEDIVTAAEDAVADAPAETMELAETMVEDLDAEANAAVSDEEVESASSADTEISLKRFNVSNLKRREAFTHGRGAAYIIDATSVLERVPNYDHYVRGIEPELARDELIRDFDVLTRELSGTFHLIFNAWFQYAATHGNTLTVEFGTGPGEGTKEASDRRLRELVFEMTAKLRPVCIVTGDSTLADSVRGQGIHIIPLGEFFRA
jgi:hypothetical protein